MIKNVSISYNDSVGNLKASFKTDEFQYLHGLSIEMINDPYACFHAPGLHLDSRKEVENLISLLNNILKVIK
jgi:hypothetical protein